MFIILAGSSRDENAYLHEKWCNGVASKLLCVSVLDRFGDYVSDQVMYFGRGEIIPGDFSYL